MPTVGPHTRSILRAACAALVLLAAGSTAHSGGSAENAVLVVDPTHPDSARIANAYVAARDIPASNILHMTPDDSAGFVTTLARNLAAFEHELAVRGIGDHVDFVVVAPTGRSRTAAGALLTDQCFPFGHVGVATNYTLARIGTELAGGTLDVTEPNRFFALGSPPVAFTSNTAWLNGAPSTDMAARRYFIGAMLGYTGTRGNTPAEIEAMITRSVGADGTFPVGTFYLCETGDVNRSGPRDPLYTAVATALNDAGAAGEHLLAELPRGKHDALGVMTGSAYPKISTDDFTLLPGAFCDHLTSWAGDFAQPDQVKMSAWIAKGASLTVGAVEEPCNYPGKFPRPEVHLDVFRGATLGEAYLRNAQYAPFQLLLYGDPLTRPFAHIPSVAVADAPAGPVVGTVTLTPTASTTRPLAAIGGFDLLLDGVRMGQTTPGGTFDIDTTALAEGPHDLRVLAHDDSPLATTGRWVGTLDVDNVEHACSLGVDSATGDLGTAFTFNLGATGADADELRLLHNGRVVAATAAPGDVVVHGRILGAGEVVLQAEALFGDGHRALSPRVSLSIAPTDPVGPAPVPRVYGYTKRLRAGGPTVVELPASFTDDPATATFEIVTAPARATVLPGSTGAFRLILAPQDEGTEEALVFRVQAPSGTSVQATVRLVYGAAPAPPPPPLPPAIVLERGRIRDRARTRRDLIQASGRLPLPEAFDPATFDPAVGAVHVEVGDASGPLAIDLPVGEPRWKFRRKWFRYTSKKTADGPRVKLRIRPDTGAFRLLVSRAEFAASHGNPVRVALSSGELEGESEAPWREHPVKPGSLDFEPAAE